ncbi:MAG TPA: hypothetical protein VG456_12280 [Candidatus Sulfopaludibacter sp.]|jgi:hypothetical protein|nr:hypothetical protein [Candidatus Sulfopaludibacter sp.]
MFKKCLCTTALLCATLAAGSIPGNKQYNVTISQPIQVGTVKLAAGDYKIKVDGATATFTDSRKKTCTAPVKVESVAKKIAITAVETKTVNGAEQLAVIDIGGSEFKLVF